MSTMLSVMMVITSIGFSSLAVNATASAPQMVLTSTDGSAKTMKADDAAITLQSTFYGGVEIDAVKHKTEFEVKGFGSTNNGSDKQPYKLKFNKDDKAATESFGLVSKQKKWRLYSLREDASLMRNKLAYDLAAKIGLQYQTRTKYVDLTVDAVNKGLYLLAEDVDPKSDRVDVDADMDDFVDVPDTYAGDCILEYEKIEKAGEYYTTAPSTGYSFCIKDPGIGDANEADRPTFQNKINEEMKAVDTALKSNNYAQVTSKMDVDSFVKLYLINELFKPKHIVDSNVYCYFKDGKLYAGPASNYDESSGNISDAPDFRLEDYKDANDEEGYWAKKYMPFVKELFKYADFRKAVRDKYAEIKTDITALCTDGTGNIDTITSTYADSIANNFKATAEGGAGWTGDNASEVAYLKTWLKNRLSWMDKTFVAHDIREYTAKLSSNKLVFKVSPKVTLTEKTTGKTLASDEYYVIYDATPLDVGKHTLKVESIMFDGSIPLIYTVNPLGTTIKKVKPLKKSFKVTWNKQLKAMSKKKITGYAVRYSLKKNMKSSKQKLVNKYSSSSVTIKKLKSKKKYYVQIATFMTVSGKKYYSAWSKAKTVKVK